MGPHMKHKAVCLPLAGTGARGRGVVSRSPRELAVRPAYSWSYKNKYKCHFKSPISCAYKGVYPFSVQLQRRKLQTRPPMWRGNDRCFFPLAPSARDGRRDARDCTHGARLWSLLASSPPLSDPFATSHSPTAIERGRASIDAHGQRGR